MTAPSNANTSGLKVVQWEYRTAPHRQWHITDSKAVAEQEARDGSEVVPRLVRAASAQARIAELGAERDAALRECSRWAREAGAAIGRLECSEAAGIVEGWRDRATAAEARADRLAKAINDIENVADSFCDDSADLLAGQIRIRTRAALQQEKQP